MTATRGANFGHRRRKRFIADTRWHRGSSSRSGKVNSLKSLRTLIEFFGGGFRSSDARNRKLVA
jgi:hypothetical protein